MHLLTLIDFIRKGNARRRNEASLGSDPGTLGSQVSGRYQFLKSVSFCFSGARAEWTLPVGDSSRFLSRRKEDRQRVA